MSFLCPPKILTADIGTVMPRNRHLIVLRQQINPPFSLSSPMVEFTWDAYWPKTFFTVPCSTAYATTTDYDEFYMDTYDKYLGRITRL